MYKLIAFALLLVGSSALAVATPIPEIDATSGGSALALIAGGLLLLRSRRKR